MMEKGAVISECGKYRYKLWRIWDRTKPFVLFIMHNPSTADADLDDPTIRRCINFAKDWGYGGLYVGNVSPYRTPYPYVLKRVLHSDAYPEDNYDHIDDMIRLCGELVLACGIPPSVPHLETIVNLIHFKHWKCIKKTKAGFPAHPLYLSKNLTLRPFVLL